MKYHGNKVPEMVWTDDSKKITLSPLLSRDDRNDVTKSTVRLIAVSTTKITCTILFLAPNITSKISWTTAFEVIGLYHRIAILINIQLLQNDLGCFLVGGYNSRNIINIVLNMFYHLCQHAFISVSWIRYIGRCD